MYSLHTAHYSSPRSAHAYKPRLWFAQLPRRELSSQCLPLLAPRVCCRDLSPFERHQMIGRETDRRKLALFFVLLCIVYVGQALNAPRAAGGGMHGVLFLSRVSSFLWRCHVHPARAQRAAPPRWLFVIHLHACRWLCALSWLRSMLPIASLT